MKRKVCWFLIVTIFLLGPNVQAAPKKINVTVSIPPLAYLAQRIGGERLDVSVMLPASGNEHTYEPTPEQLRELSNSQMYVKLGTGIEFELAWMEKFRALNGDMIICDAAQGIDLIKMIDEDEEEHEEGHHHGYDPHIWLSLRKAKMMVFNIRNTLIQIDPAHWEEYMNNSNELLKEMAALDDEITYKLLKPKKRIFIVVHPAWGYFAQDYVLQQIAIEDEGKEPSPKDLMTIVEQARALKIKTIFVSPQFNQKNAQVIADEIKGKVVTIDPLSKDYLNNMRQAAEAFYRALK